MAAASRDRFAGQPGNTSVADAARSNAIAMGKYFGPLRNSDVESFASDAFASETLNLPDAYKGRNKFLMATIDFLITKDDDWYTRYILPWLYTEEIHVKWNIWRFNRTMMDYEPEQGVPRYVSYESESRSDSLVRRGLAFIIEHGFYKTEIGRQHYLMNLKQITEAVHETVYYGVMHELLAAPNYYQQWQKKHGKTHSIVSNDAITTLAEERWRFACVQKDIKGLFVLDAEIKDRMRRVGIEPDSWIFPSKMAIYASMVPEYFNEYSRGGEKATRALEDGAKRFDTFRGCRVFETRSFDTDFMSEDAIEPLVRIREVGEYYLIGDHKNDYQHGIRIFDMSRDKFHTVSYHEAKEKCAAKDEFAASLCSHYEAQGCNTVGDAIRKAFNLPANADLAGCFNGNDPAGRHPTVTEECYQFLCAQNDCNRRGDVGAYNEGITAGEVDNYVGELNAGQAMSLPHKMLLFRPRMTYRMATAVLVKGGEELGQTLHGHHDFQLTDDVIHKTHIGHYTFYSKSVVREPKNMYLAEDVYCTGYEGGENTTFVDPGQGDAEDQVATIADHMQRTVNAASASLVSAMVPYDHEVSACISLAGDLSAHGLATRFNSGDGGWHGSEAFAQLASALNQHPETVYGVNNDEETGANGVCFRGAEEQYDDSNGWTTRQRNTGHWGPNVYAGCANVRLGMYAHLKDISGQHGI